MMDAALNPFRYCFEAIGTQWEIDTPEPLPAAVLQRIAACIEQFDRTYSRFRPDSLVTQLAQAPAGGRVAFPADSSALFQLYDRLHTLTEGAVDPLVGRRLEQLGYDSQYSLRPQASSTLPTPPAVDWRRDVVRTDSTLCTRRPLVIDVGAAGKGYLVDLVAELLRDAGVAAFTVDAGGDIWQEGTAPLRVGLEHPLDAAQVMAFL